MIVSIVAHNVRSGGGRELLVYLLNYLEDNYPEVMVYAYLDKSLSNIHSTQNRKLIFYSSNLSKLGLLGRRMNNALYFGNLPPMRKTNNSVLYIHNSYLTMPFAQLWRKSTLYFVKYSLQRAYIKFFIRNVSLVACQTKSVKSAVLSIYGGTDIRVKILPFFRLCDKAQVKTRKKKFDFCYISLAHPHKGHSLLLDAIQIIAKEGLKISLALTIEKDKFDLLDRVDKLNQLDGVYIENKGVISKDKVCSLYAESKCLVFPSSEESFGLGLVEAVDMGIDVISSDLDYVFNVIKPSAVFDPKCPESLANLMREYLIKGNFNQPSNLVENKIDELIKAFKGG